MSRFSDFDKLVADFMQEDGFTATLVHLVSSTPNDATGTTNKIVENIPVRAIKMELIRPVEGSGSKTNTSIQDGDLTLYVQPANKTDPLSTPFIVNPTSDRFVINGVSWKIVTVKMYEPDATDCILYEFYIRK